MYACMVASCSSSNSEYVFLFEQEIEISSDNVIRNIEGNLFIFLWKVWLIFNREYVMQISDFIVIYKS